MGRIHTLEYSLQYSENVPIPHSPASTCVFLKEISKEYNDQPIFIRRAIYPQMIQINKALTSLQTAEDK